MRKALFSVLAAVAAAAMMAGGGASAATPAPAPAPATTEDGPTVTFVNQSGETLWIGSGVNADGSENPGGLPAIEDGQQATVTVPMSGGHWRGKFFGRQGCAGDDGSSFHCAIGDCGPSAGSCTTGEQPTSLAEFNFDPADQLAPWYNVSYVNGVSTPITIDAAGSGAHSPRADCESVGCSEPLLQYCPPENLTTDDSGKPVLCTNPSRDEKTPYSDAISSHCPLAYAWSKQDTEGGNQVVRQCAGCSGFTVTFHHPV
ncbi:thaumatin family protein [Amycolatopsis ultiminotia]|uniref:Thaumatin family protein n=1 Tax=Amycolatopsis ultiminotia TaxID=543629 RepID=A0ABP6VDS7_9PSEU